MQGAFQVVTTVSALTAFLGGILSFFSPCIFPILPGYVGFILGDTKSAKGKVLKSLGFILGLSSVFILLGALSGIIGTILVDFKQWISIIGGILIITLGLSYLEIIKLPKLNLVRKNERKKASGFFSAIGLGIAISFVWVPCVSPVLGSILVLAANSSSMWQGIGLLSLYSLGMGIPLFIISMFVSVVYKMMPKLLMHEKKLKIAGGVMLIAVGILMVFGLLNYLQGV